MKGFAALLMAAALLLCLGSPAMALGYMEKPHAGQLISVNCEADIDYSGGFYLSSLCLVSRDGAELTLHFPAARLSLRDFFARSEQRRFTFSDGSYISGSDFDAQGNFTGEYHSVSRFPATGTAAKEQAWLDPASIVTLCTRMSRAGTEVELGGEDIWGADRKRCLEKLGTLLGSEKPLWSDAEKLEIFFETGSEELVAIEAQLIGLNSMQLYSSDAEVFCPIGTGRVLPTGAGRAVLTLSNQQGNTLLQLSVSVREEGEGYQLSCICPKCEEDTGDSFHLLPCGHYSCAVEDASLHEPADCAIIGHCATDGLPHQRCSNCLKPICDGLPHGVGICEHEHNWVDGIVIPPTATSDGSSSSSCASCGYVYTQTIPRTG